MMKVHLIQAKKKLMSIPKPVVVDRLFITSEFHMNDYRQRYYLFEKKFDFAHI